MTKIILAGATGLTGSHLVPMLVRDGHEVHIIGRRAIPELPDGVIKHIQNTTEWPAVVRKVGAEIAISCLGTTIKQAGSKDAFRAVDFDLITGFANVAKEGGAGQFITVSSAGASANSSNFYLKTKGETERAIGTSGFDRVDSLRPGLLRGNRAGPSRPGESIASLLSPVTDMLMIGGLDRYRSICAETVAKAIAALAGQPGSGRFIHENREIEALAR